MKRRENKHLVSGTSGERSRDLRIKRPHLGLAYLCAILGGFRRRKVGREARVTQCLFSRPSVASDTDPLAPLRRWTAGAR